MPQLYSEGASVASCGGARSIPALLTLSVGGGQKSLVGQVDLCYNGAIEANEGAVSLNDST